MTHAMGFNRRQVARSPSQEHFSQRFWHRHQQRALGDTHQHRASSSAPNPPFLAHGACTRASPRALSAHVRRLHFERLAAVELHRVAPLALVLLPVEVGGDAALAVRVGAARAVDLHPLVHQGGVLYAWKGGFDGETSVKFKVRRNVSES